MMCDVAASNTLVCRDECEAAHRFTNLPIDVATMEVLY
jgi:hypothetical protein